METINWGIIGCGDVTEKKSGPAFNKVPNSQLVAVMRRDADKAADYARRHGVPKWYSDAGQLMDDAEINAVYIATPPAYHLPYALEALKRGLHVYVEKPVTMNAAEAIAMAEAVKKSNAKLTVAHYRRALPYFLKIKQLLQDGTIGEVRSVQLRMWQARKPALVANSETNWRVQPDISGGGYFHDLAPHQLDILLYYFGNPLKYHGFSLNQAGESSADDNVNGQILFSNNIPMSGSWSFNVADNAQAEVCEIVGSKGKISFPFFGSTITLNGETIPFTHPEHIQQPMIEQVVRYFSNEQANPCSIDEAVTLMQIMDAFTQK